MPWPISLYQGPFSLPMSMPAAFQRSSSAIWVPERSPREMKGAPLDLMAFKASATSVMPLMPAGSLFGPIRTKALYITGYRLTPKPSATNLSSCALACTNSTSASPRRPVSSAWPVPCATTFTSMPVLALNSGRMWPNRPESCVDVVEATTMDLSCARAGAAATSVMVAAKTTRLRRVGMMFSSSYAYREIDDGQTKSSPAVNRRASSVLGAEKKASAGALDHAAAMHQHDFAGEPLGLAEIVGRHHYLDAARGDLSDHVLDRLGRGGMEAGGRLIEQEDLRLLGERGGERKPLLLAAGELARWPALEPVKTDERAELKRVGSASRARHAGGGERIADIARGAAAKHRRPLEYDGAMRGCRLLAAAPAHTPAGGRDQPHDEPQQRGLARAVRADQHSGRSGPKRKRDALEDRHAAGGEVHVFEHDRQIGDGRAHGLPRKPFAR